MNPDFRERVHPMGQPNQPPHQTAHSYPTGRRPEQPIQYGPVDYSGYGPDPHATYPPQATSVRGQLGSRWVWMTLIGMAVFIATYFLAVRTYLGQYLENSALLGAQQATSGSVTDALESLQVISLVSLGVMMGVFVIVGLIRRSWRIAFAGIVTLGASAVIAEVLKKYILDRPDLAPIYENNAHNSFPSGHAAVAMAILISLLLVTSYRWRGLVMLLAMGWAVSVGEAAVTARWHRVSDTLASDMLVLVVGALVALWLLRKGSIETREHKTYPLRAIFVAIMTVLGFSALVVGVLLAVLNLSNFGVFADIAAARAAGTPLELTAHLDPVFNQNMFFAAQSLAYAFSTLSALWFWATFHRLGTKKS